jgi:hypothetical protein
MKASFAVAGALALAIGTAYAADYTAKFGPPTYTGDANGVKLTGQDGWYLPSGIDYKVYTYAGNALGLPDHPTGGGTQFAGGRSDGGTNFARSQHAVDFTTRDEWTISFDIAVGFNGTLPASDYLGSFSQQNSASALYFQTLNRWTNINTAETWIASYVYEDAAGVAVPLPGNAPTSAWENLKPYNWYRQSTTFELTTKRILSVSITDLHTGDSSTVKPTDWFLVGTKSGRPLATDVRMFTGGGVAGNLSGWDNLRVIPEPTTAAGLLVLLAAGLIRRR